MTHLTSTRRAGLALALAASLFAAVPAASAADAKATVDAAKARGEAGEQSDGYIGLVVPSVSPEVRAAVAEINGGRTAAYRDAAAKTGVTPDAAAQATAKQLVARLPAGQYYKPLNGGWTRK